MLRVADLMTVEPDTVSPDTSLLEVVDRLKADSCRQLPVMDDEGHLVGIITDRDIRLAMNSPLVLHERSQDLALLGAATAGSVMSPNPITVAPDTPAAQAAKILSTYKFGALPVLDGDVLVGIVTVTDFLDYLAESLQALDIKLAES